jgi:putative sugar O-methyltransferase
MNIKQIRNNSMSNISDADRSQAARDLAQVFISNSPDFFADLKTETIDEKHREIVGEAYKTLSRGGEDHWWKFRTWSFQSDAQVVPELSIYNFKYFGVVDSLLRFFYGQIFGRKTARNIRQEFQDDIAVIKMTGGQKYLEENPVSESPIPTRFSKIQGFRVNHRWLRYIYLLTRILQEKMVFDGSIWVDIGPYYGGLQGLVKKYSPNTTIVLVDFHHQLCKSYIYLSSMFPEAEHVLPNAIPESLQLSDYSKGAIFYVPVSRFEQIRDVEVQLVTNFVSLGEMRREVFAEYMTSPLFQNAAGLYLVNRFVSAPFFEPTYDTDLTVLDYVEDQSTITYFDIFPIHHYNQITRLLFGKMAARNVSSPYFELVIRKN